MRPIPALLLLSLTPLWACHSDPDKPAPDDSGTPGGDSAPDSDDSAPDSPPDSRDDSAPDTDTGTPLPQGDLFDDQVVHQILIRISQASARALNRDPKTYVEADVEIDGTPVQRVGVHLKGSSSMRTLAQKAAFKVDINRFVDGQDYQGITKFTLNNMVNDDTQLHENMAFRFFRAIGQPNNRCAYGWVRVAVEGAAPEDYGLYNVLETWNGDWLDRNYGGREARIYEGGYPYYPDGWEHADLSRREAQNFELEYGDDVQNADVIAAAQVIATADGWDAAASAVIDLDTFADYYMGEVWVGHWDGYVFAINNSRLYAAPDGRVQVLPSGLDWTFQDWASWTSPQSALGRPCYQDADCRERLRAAAIRICDRLDEEALLVEFDRLQALIDPYLQQDPRKEYQYNRVGRTQRVMRGWIGSRCDDLAGIAAL